MEHPLTETTIAHIDVNSAFLSWTATQRLIDDPTAVDLRTIPSAVGGDKERRHGIILAKSIPAKKYDITTGEPVIKALQKCPNLVLVKPDFHTYRKFSNAFIDILNKYTPAVEQVSIDEAFIDLTGTSALYKSALSVVYQIKDEIKDTLGFTVNVGLSSNKFLAKMASDFEKPDKVHTLYPEEIAEKMWPLKIGDMYGIGKATAAKLTRLGVMTIGDAVALGEDKLIQILGPASGRHLFKHANGVGDTVVRVETDDAKSYGNSVTLERDITAENRETVLPSTVLALSDSVAARMRRDGFFAGTICANIRTNEFVNHSKQTTLGEPTNSTDEIYSVALSLVCELWDGRTPLRLVGVTGTNLTQQGLRQESLFEDSGERLKKERRSRIDAATDGIRGRFGKKALTRGSLISEPVTDDVNKKER